MGDYIASLKDWIVALGEEHEVDPLLLGCLYLISKPGFFFFLGWTIKKLRAKKVFLTQLLIACSFFSLPYLYVVIAGRNISPWVYICIVLLFASGAYSIWKKVTAKVDPTLPV
ncbi:hypothetical protein DYU05_01200 [Mucilaginibacter terrenus]|uniref:Uncharacterized protein n=1 Tax=Mucilaginibacter terrenus TaxID=2482727 RepID=A0A3E2NTD3_9SPHI|nr:hypothetical protein [Mucilaginibacter terrenus]RFZ84275.1 hypothetical protein DYU05_01200 [Mucilaginibacter terrenus]